MKSDKLEPLADDRVFDEDPTASLFDQPAEDEVYTDEDEASVDDSDEGAYPHDGKGLYDLDDEE